MFLVLRFYVKLDKMADYQKWLLSDKAKDMMRRFEKETGWKYIDTYFPILGFGEDIIEKWFEVPNWAALDRSRTSKVWDEWVNAVWDFRDLKRAASSVVYRAASDVMIPKKKK